MAGYISSIQEVSETIQSQVYPNPSIDNVTIKFENVNSKSFDLTITDEKRQIVKQKRNIKQSEIRLDITGFKAGMYFYYLANNDANTYAKGAFVKE